MLIAMLLAMQTAEKTAWNPTLISTMAAGVALLFLALLGLAILYYVFTGKIDLSGLISEPNGEASMSRFQLLIFTFLIAACLFLIVASKGPPGFPEDIPQGILILLGISSSSYLVSKGIQASSKQGLGGAQGPQVTIKGPTTGTFGSAPLQYQAVVLGLTDETVTWSIEPATSGTIDQTGLYTPPAEGEAGSRVTIKATSKEDVGATDTETITLT